jgi:hypothetical protein
MEFFEAFPNHEISQGELEIYPLPLKMIQDTRISMTTEAGHFIMRGCLPGVDIFLHIVTEATK